MSVYGPGYQDEDLHVDVTMDPYNKYAAYGNYSGSIWKTFKTKRAAKKYVDVHNRKRDKRLGGDPDRHAPHMKAYADRYRPLNRRKKSKSKIIDDGIDLFANPRGPQRIITDARGLAKLMKNPTIRSRVKNISEGVTIGKGPTRTFKPYREAYGGDYDPSRLSKASLAHEPAAIRAEFDKTYAKKRRAVTKRKPAAKKRKATKKR